MSLPASQLTQQDAPDAGQVEQTEGESSAVAGRSPFQLAVARYRRDRLSMFALIVVVLVFVLGIVGPILVLFGVLDYQVFDTSLLTPDTLPKGRLGGVSWDHPLGVEPGSGRDVLSRVWLGITLSLAIAIAGTVLTILIGTVMGIVSGFSGGKVDAVIGRIIDLTLSFPSTLMLLALSSTVVTIFEKDLHVPTGPDRSFVLGLYVVVVLSVFGWPPTARIIRGQVLSLREREFVDAAVLFGASRMRLYFKEILPNLWAPLLVYFTLTLPAYVSAEAALSFLGVGIQAPTPTLGNVLTSSLPYNVSDPFFFLFPAALIAIIVVSFNLMGDGLRDALDPKAHR